MSFYINLVNPSKGAFLFFYILILKLNSINFFIESDTYFVNLIDQWNEMDLFWRVYSIRIRAIYFEIRYSMSF